MQSGPLLLGLALFAVSACANPLGGARTSSKAWVGKTSTSVIMVQMTRADHALTGTLDETSVSGEAATDVKPDHLAFTGTVQDSAITLSFPGGFGTVTNISGTLTDSTMTLQIPQDDGSVAAIKLRPGTIDDYNRDVAALHTGADANAAEQAQAVADEEDADRLQAQQAELSSAADAVTSGNSTLQAALAEPPPFAAFDTHLGEAKKNLATTKKYAAAAGQQSDPYDACNTAYDAQNSAYDVTNSGYDIDNDANDLDIAIGDIDDAAKKLKANLSTYKSEAAALPGFTPPNAPDASEVAGTLRAAATKTSAWRETGKSYKRQSAALIKKATAVAEAANKKYCE